MLLECHSKGDCRFSALYVRIASGKTIEYPHQRSKRDANGLPFSSPKGQHPVFFALGKRVIINEDGFQHFFSGIGIFWNAPICCG